LLETADKAIPGNLDRLFPLVYDELRVLAHRQLGSERPDHTLRTTALVHEAYLRLVDDTRATRKGRAYFFAAAARAMRQILVDHARRRNAAKRGGGAENLSLDHGDIAVDRFAHELIDLDRALHELAKLNPRHAQVVECRFFGGLDVDETAEALGVSARTVKYDWALARAWLYGALGGESQQSTVDRQQSKVQS
jgi:RNA polymerase sigma factor (TIGR02999 family)